MSRLLNQTISLDEAVENDRKPVFHVPLEDYCPEEESPKY
jgi:hypothetical protein